VIANQADITKAANIIALTSEQASQAKKDLTTAEQKAGS
jgi:hypothetical protein